jgi:rhamnosyltransferase
MTPYASVIIPTKNATDKFNTVLAAIFNNKPNFDFEVIVVDSGSTDNTKNIIAKFPVRLIEIAPTSFTHGGARNLGSSAARGEALVFITQDAVPEGEHWLTNLTESFQDTRVAGVYGRQIPYPDSSYYEKFFLSYLYPQDRRVKEGVRPKNCSLQDIFFSNVNSAIRKSDWQGNNFREDIIMSEDQYWAKAVLGKGRRLVYEPKAAVYHSHYYSTPEIIKRNFDSGMSLRGLINPSIGSSIGYELSYLWQGVCFLGRRRLCRDLCFFAFYEGARALGFSLGFHSNLLPLSWKRGLSQNKIYWLSYFKSPDKHA